MKKKLSLKSLEVQSFVTTVEKTESGNNRGGDSLVCPTNASCMDVMSCAAIQCTYTLRYCQETESICLTTIKQ